MRFSPHERYRYGTLFRRNIDGVIVMIVGYVSDDAPDDVLTGEGFYVRAGDCIGLVIDGPNNPPERQVYWRLHETCGMDGISSTSFELWS